MNSLLLLLKGNKYIQSLIDLPIKNILLCILLLINIGSFLYINHLTSVNKLNKEVIASNYKVVAAKDKEIKDVNLKLTESEKMNHKLKLASNIDNKIISDNNAAIIKNQNKKDEIKNNLNSKVNNLYKQNCNPVIKKTNKKVTKEEVISKLNSDTTDIATKETIPKETDGIVDITNVNSNIDYSVDIIVTSVEISKLRIDSINLAYCNAVPTDKQCEQ